MQPTRREFMQLLGAGILVTVAGGRALGQAESGVQAPAGRRGGREAGGGGGGAIGARIHIGKDGVVTVMSGKVECGQGARAEIGQAAAEELRLPLGKVVVVLADTALTPNDGGTYGSQTTPRTLPAVRQAAAAARSVLIAAAARAWGVETSAIELRDGKALHAASKREMGYGELAASEEATRSLAQPAGNVTVTAVSEWKVMGSPALRHDARDMVTGRHAYPTDITRPGMGYGKVLRPPAYGAKLVSLDEAAAKSIGGVKLVRDGEFVGVVAPNSFLADKAVEALAQTAQWQGGDKVASTGLAAYLTENVRGGVPANPFAAEVASAPKRFKQSYFVPYVQHAPLEPRTAAAAWADGKLTVWTGTQNPFGVRSEVARALGLGEESVRIIVPDFGGGFGGKHTGEAAAEAARLAKGAGQPVMLRWSRAEEFTWAYFRPAGVIQIEAALDAAGRMTVWHFVNINSGNAGLEMPYAVASKRTQYVQSNPPLRHGSYRGLAATANNFARECAVDELAGLAGKDPLAFRMEHLEDQRLRAVLQAAAKKFGWGEKTAMGHAVGLACGVEKGSYVAACAEVAVDKGLPVVKRLTQAFECGAIVNPLGLLQQVQGAMVQGLGPALWEEMKFDAGKIANAAFARYRVPRFADLPVIEVELVDRKDLPSAGAGETPIICVAPAIANAVSALMGKRVRELPVKA
jgi:isoquinoline 1-oxidoreductase